jgi:CheY-like chemotaxis protein
MTALNGCDALEIAAVVPPEVLITDLLMPGLSGLDLAIEIRRTVPDCVGSRTGALMLGSGGHSFAFAQDLSPVTMITSPVPATSNRTGAFDASGFPIDFTIELSGIPFAHE